MGGVVAGRRPAGAGDRPRVGRRGRRRGRGGSLTPEGHERVLLGRAALSGPVDEVARHLLGCVVATPDVAVRLTEVEAYGGTDDPASHAARGPTPRTRGMHGRAGHAYVYRSYGVHWCLNVVAGPDGVAGAVLLRAGEVVAGVPVARGRRGATGRDADLCRGPGRLCRSLGVTGHDDGTDLLLADARVRLLAADAVEDAAVLSGPRVGVSRARERPWRWWVRDDPTVSRWRPGRGPSGVART